MNKSIELCSNNEWLAGNGPLVDLGIGSNWQDEAGDEWFSEVAKKIRDEFPDITVEAASGQRILYHGWNGMNLFERKCNGRLVS